MGMILRAHFSEFVGLNRLDKFVFICIVQNSNFFLWSEKTFGRRNNKSKLIENLFSLQS